MCNKGLQTGSEKGDFKRHDPHPDIEGRWLIDYIPCKNKDGTVTRHRENWGTKRPPPKKKTNQTGSEKGTFRRGDQHPEDPNLLFYSYQKRESENGHTESWYDKDNPPKNFIGVKQKSHITTQTGEPKGTYERYDPHPTVPNYYYSGWSDYHYDRCGSGETWWSEEYFRSEVAAFDNYIKDPSCRTRRNDIKDGFLTDLNDSFNCYLLGLIYADGSIRGAKIGVPIGSALGTGINSKDRKIDTRISLKQNKKDFEDLDIIEKLHVYGVVTIHEDLSAHKKNKGKPAVSLQFSNLKIYEFLRDHGYGIKSHKGSDARIILNAIPEANRHFWFRGFLDGDGTVRKDCQEISFVSHIDENWAFLTELFKELSIHKTSYRIEANMVKSTGHKKSILGLTKTQDLYKFGSYIWPDNDLDIGFLRKFSNWLKIKERYNHFIENELPRKYISQCKRDLERFPNSKTWSINIGKGAVTYSRQPIGHVIRGGKCFATLEEAREHRDYLCKLHGIDLRNCRVNNFNKY